MSSSCRLWIARDYELVRPRPCVIVVRGSKQLEPVEAPVHDELREPGDLDAAAAFRQRVVAVLNELAIQHTGKELALVVGPRVQSACVAIALELVPGQVELRLDACCAIDWPSSQLDRPALVGVDLDWSPPPAAQRASKFPGGPGSAPATRG